MVMQSDFKNDVLTLLSQQTFVLELGEDTSVTSNDNDITTVNLTKNNVDIDTTIVNDSLVHGINVATGEGNGYDYNALMLNFNGNSMNKCLFNTLTKTSSVVWQITLTETMLYE